MLERRLLRDRRRPLPPTLSRRSRRARLRHKRKPLIEPALRIIFLLELEQPIGTIAVDGLEGFIAVGVIDIATRINISSDSFA